MNTRILQFILALALTLLVGCSSQPQNNSQSPSTQSAAKPKTAEANQLKAGREALQSMYASARVWAGDSQPVSLTSNPRKGDTAGKAAVWNASFASASKRSIRNFTWSGATGDNA